MKCKQILLVFMFIMMAVCAFADGPDVPCGDEQDPFDNDCPMDSWVYLLVLTPVTVTLGSVLSKSNPEDEKNPDDDNDNTPL